MMVQLNLKTQEIRLQFQNLILLPYKTGGRADVVNNPRTIKKSTFALNENYIFAQTICFVS